MSRAKCALAQWILEALHHYTYTGCGEEQWLSKILPLREARYLNEEVIWLGSRKNALVIFSLVWGIMRCKDEASFNEGFFVEQFYPLMGTGRDKPI